MAPQVLVLGMPRTGTQSIGEALIALGYRNAYHMTSVGPNGHHDKWVAALEAKFEHKGTEFGKREFDDLLAGFDVVSDFPCSIFYEELMTAYPAAHVVLTTRDEDAWVASAARTLHHAYATAAARPSRLARLYHLHLWGDDFLAHGRAAFRRHNAAVLRAAAAQRRPVLQFDPAMGWDALCGFLGRPAPPGLPYPRKDMWAGYKSMAKAVEAGRLAEGAVTGEREHVALLENSTGAADRCPRSEATSLSPPEQAEGIRAAYIYTQSPKDQAEGIRAAYIYTQSPKDQAEGIRAAYIYTQSPKDQAEGIRAAYIYTQSPKDQLEGIKAAYIYTQ